MQKNEKIKLSQHSLSYMGYNKKLSSISFKLFIEGHEAWIRAHSHNVIEIDLFTHKRQDLDSLKSLEVLIKELKKLSKLKMEQILDYAGVES